MSGLRGVSGNPAAPPYTNGPYTFDQNLTLKGRVTLNPNRYALSEDFRRLPSLNTSIGVATNLDFEVLGTNASADDVTHAATIGGIQLQTDGADNDQVIILPHLDTSQTAWSDVKWGTENQLIWEAVIRTAAITLETIWLGLKLTNTSVIITDADQVWFRYNATADTNWQCLYSIGGVDTAVDSGVAVAANTNVHFRIEIDSDRKAHFFINDNEVAVSAALTDDKNLIPYIGIHANTGAAKTMNIVWERISRIIFE